MLKVFKNVRALWLMIILSVVVLGGVMAMIVQKISKEKIPSANCLSRGTGVYTEQPLSELVNDSPVIAVVKVNEKPENDNMTVDIQNVLKGKIGEDAISLCSEYNDVKVREKLLVFLEGRDQENRAWLVAYGGIKHDTGGNRYTIQGKSYNLDEIRKAIKEQN